VQRRATTRVRNGSALIGTIRRHKNGSLIHVDVSVRAQSESRADSCRETREARTARRRRRSVATPSKSLPSLKVVCDADFRLNLFAIDPFVSGSDRRRSHLTAAQRGG
jgi:hypothetical protein